MALFDLPLEELRRYTPPVAEPADFDEFWLRTLAETRAHELAADFVPVAAGLPLVETFDVTFAGYAGQPIKAWLLLPRARAAPLPCVVEYVGYGGGRGLAQQRLFWVAAGFAHFVMDTRGQGSQSTPGDTPDVEADGGSPQHPGFLTRGVLHPTTYYYRRVFGDAVRAVEAARAHEDVDPARVAVVGGSQGGGITLAVAGLAGLAGPTGLDRAAAAGERPTGGGLVAAMPDVPFLCHFRRATEITDETPYAEIVGYLRAHRDHVERVFETLSYFDGVSFARRASAPALFSVGLMDQVCPPSTVFAAYNAYGGPKEIVVYPFNCHEGGATAQQVAQARHLRRLLPEGQRTRR